MKKHYNIQKINGELATRRLSAKAKEFYNGSDPLDVYEILTAEGIRYDVRGFLELDSVTFEEMEETFEALYDEFQEGTDE